MVETARFPQLQGPAIACDPKQKVGQSVDERPVLHLASSEVIAHNARSPNVAQAMMENGPVDRFGDKISSARIVGAVNRIYIIQPGHHQHRNMPAFFRSVSYLPANGKAVHLGHDHVEQNYVGFGALKG